MFVKWIRVKTFKFNSRQTKSAVILKMRLFSLCFLLLFVGVASELQIGAFNVKTLGKTKMGKPVVVDYLVQVRTVLLRFDFNKMCFKGGCAHFTKCIFHVQMIDLEHLIYIL